MPEPDKSASWVYVVSDGTGDTGAAVVKAAMVQFQSPWRLRVFPDVRSERDARRVIPLAVESGALVVFSLVDKRVASELLREAEQQGVATVDLLGPLISKISQRLHVEPRHQPGLLHGFSDDYFRRVEAVEFAVRHDDGANLHTLCEADIVLTGVSRTSKTPLSMHLAQRGYKTGNVPLVPGLDPPRQLLELDSRKVFGLLIDPGFLFTVRQARLRALRTSPNSSYVDADAIELEIRRARRLYREYRFRSIEVTGRAVEENAARILELYEADPIIRPSG